jgi:hypothetical protein
MEPIDAVISWVDGYDPIHQQKLKLFCDQHHINKNLAIEPTRIQQVNEIHYCLHALRRFAPWIRNIYIITDQQTPPTVSALQGIPFGDKIKIIDQNTLLHEYGVTSPVFNSLSVEWLIWKIKGLSNQFLYLNDDFFIIRDVTPDDFFKNRRMVLRGKWKTQAHKKYFYQIKQYMHQYLGFPKPKLKTNPHRAWQEHSARLAGWSKQFYLLPHAPFPIIKTTFETFVANEPQLFIQNIRYPFRHPDQISSIPLMVHIDLKNNRAIENLEYQAIMVNGATHSLKKIKSRLNHAHKNHHVAFVCMQSIDQAPLATQDYMLQWLEQHIDSKNIS